MDFLRCAGTRAGRCDPGGRCTTGCICRGAGGAFPAHVAAVSVGRVAYSEPFCCLGRTRIGRVAGGCSPAALDGGPGREPGPGW